MRKRISVGLWKVFLATYTIMLTTILVLCITETQEKVPVHLMIIYPILGLVIFSFIAFIGVKLERFLIKYEKVLLVIFFVLYTIATVRFTLHSRGIPANDSESLINGAYYFAGLTEEMEWTYFARWNHQVIPAVLLGFVFRIATWLQISDVYYLAWGLNIVHVLCTLYCTYKLAHRFSKHGTVSGWLVMGMMAIYIPIWGHTQSLYTDAFSFGIGMIAFYIWLCNYEKRNRGWKYWCINILAGLLWSIGYEIKATVIISLIAVFFYLILFEDWKVLVKNIVCLLIPLFSAIVICSSYVKTLPCMEYEDSWGVPAIEYFIGLGLEADGSFRLDSEFFNKVAGGIWGMEEKKAYAREFIRENIDQFWNAEHMIAKARHNFASGKMKADDFMQEVEHPGFLYNCISYTGAYRRTYRTFVAAYWYMLLEFTLIACVLRICQREDEKKKVEPAVAVPILSVCGIMMYVMIFEANNRQLYNHIPMFFSAASIGIWMIQNKIENFLAKKKKIVSGETKN